MGILNSLLGPIPRQGGYEDCPTWSEVRHKMRMIDANPIGKSLTAIIFGWAFVQYAGFTISGVDAPFWWDVLVALILPCRWTFRAFALAVAYRVYGGVVPIVSLIGSL